MKVLITGARGMLGSNLVSKLQERDGHEVFSHSRQVGDLRDQSSFNKVLRDFRPDAVIHAAAKVGGIQANVRNPVSFLMDNLRIDTSVISASLRNEVGTLVYVGSSCMYPKDFRQPLMEEDLLAAPLEPTNEGYALAKITGAKLCEYASREEGVSYKTIVPSNLYGPGDNFDPSSSHLLASVIRKVHLAKMSDEGSISVWGSGRAKREFTYVGDVATWLSDNLKGITNLPPLLNLGNGGDHTVDEYYRVAMEVIGHDVELIHDETKPDGMMVKLMSSEIARKEFGWNPTTSLSDGISRTYQWFLKQHSGDLSKETA